MRRSARRGISLFEAVAALAIVGVTAISALAAAGAEMRTAEKARRALEVEALATQRLDFLTLLNDKELTSLPDTVANGQFDPPLDHYKWTTTSTAVSDQQGLYDVQIAILWTEGSYKVHTFLYRHPQILPANGRGARGGR